MKMRRSGEISVTLFQLRWTGQEPPHGNLAISVTLFQLRWTGQESPHLRQLSHFRPLFKMHVANSVISFYGSSNTVDTPIGYVRYDLILMRRTYTINFRERSPTRKFNSHSTTQAIRKTLTMSCPEEQYRYQYMIYFPYLLYERARCSVVVKALCY
jgi:hypothetical protein